MEFEARTDDGIALAGTLTVPEGPGAASCVLALHAAAFGAREHPIYQHLVQTLVPEGLAVALFDRRGEGASRGDVGASLDRLAEDGRTVLRTLVEVEGVDPTRIGVWGISQGGWLGPMIAAREASVAFVIAVSAPGVSPSAQMHFAMENVLRERGFGDEDVAAAHAARSAIEAPYLAGDLEAARAARRAVDDEPWVSEAYLPDLQDLMGEPFGIDLEPSEVFAQVRVPTLAVYGAWDRWVPVDASIEVWRSAFAEHPDDLTIVRVPDVGHMMTTPLDRGDHAEVGPIAHAYAARLRSWITSV